MWCPLLPLEKLNASRAQVIDALKSKGISAGISYEVLHLATAFQYLGYKRGDFPNSELIGDSTISLPLFTQMELHHVDFVCNAVSEVFTEFAK
jgi:dTDP-4-amino-4,6-dideoxygalactose transaminase